MSFFDFHVKMYDICRSSMVAESFINNSERGLTDSNNYNIFNEYYIILYFKSFLLEICFNYTIIGK